MPWPAPRGSTTAADAHPGDGAVDVVRGAGSPGLVRVERERDQDPAAVGGHDGRERPGAVEPVAGLDAADGGDERLLGRVGDTGIARAVGATGAAARPLLGQALVHVDDGAVRARRLVAPRQLVVGQRWVVRELGRERPADLPAVRPGAGGRVVGDEVDDPVVEPRGPDGPGAVELVELRLRQPGGVADVVQPRRRHDQGPVLGRQARQRAGPGRDPAHVAPAAGQRLGQVIPRQRLRPFDIDHGEPP